ncbi:Polymer-forming cytoskeletal protein [Sulfidibacter corallicola]|uniref:Polymer-forming cytoskeletal protein n=1 Tax=Sulfidibacter corallicola TaxID=2818388 RepID=A0A8A4TW51_SULCO|nr:polymer-forming cytoskeletal protein [Sulfidibacter corallicola]QTD53713.1 polymer-forming cytoskeletal protein [Sulfidibacter corallicola]
MADNGFLSGLIMEGTRFEGKLIFKNKMRIDGEFSGEIVSEDQLIVGKKACVEGSIKCGQMVVMGEVRGHITECSHLQIQENGKVYGDIRVGILEIKPGAIFDGKCAMISDYRTEKTKAGKS